ncbi:hypothetical protein [Rhabdothermincola salaria]|uniref:hypothetical protein n=1 Tax=Rhabdothermincola salaria TaxID=2903142 RepID=UPI001E6524EF|nr:hypothetical protein [Rhabdothermincola salaria]MCD9623465.1 hypothetical protein [Rhabdothermincola salaria]
MSRGRSRARRSRFPSLVVVGAAALLASACGPPVTNSTQVDFTCVFDPQSPVVSEQIGIVTVTAPETALAGVDVPVSVQLEMPGLSPASITVYDLVITSTYEITGPVASPGTVQFDQGPADYPVGTTVPFETFDHIIDTTGPGTVTIAFVDVDYRFTFSSGGDQVVADCTVESSPVVVAEIEMVS